MKSGLTANRYAHCVEAGVLDLLKVPQRHEAVPVLFKDITCVADLFAQGVLVYHASI